MSKRPAAPLDLSIRATTGRAFVSYLRRLLPEAHRLVQPALSELSIALVGDIRMAGLHERFMGIPGPTDVLTFELDHDHRERVTTGEIVICVPYARRTAKRLGHPLRSELLLYAIHGMLHLCGFDDRTERDFRAMHRREDEILTRLGIGNVFDLGLPPSRPIGRSPSGGIR